MSTVLRVRLTGDDAQLGRVAAGDVARMLLGIERAVARAAGHVVGRQVKSTGRRGRAIEATTRFRLLDIERGSVVGVLELPEQAANADVPSLGQLALGSALATAAGEETEQVDVAEALVWLVDDVGVGSRFRSLTLEEEGPAGRKMVTLDRPARDRFFEIVSAAPSARDDSLVGVLVGADFESNTARRRTTGGQRIAISFETELADRIQEGLRRQSEFRGEVSYDPKTLEARSVSLRSIVRGDQLVMGFDAGDFWAPGEIDKLAAERKIRRVEDVDTLRDREASDEEVDRLLAALDEM
ncbi:MAG: hypothetical protein WKF33_07335 [Thermoleophilaceae bacterium]